MRYVVYMIKTKKTKLLLTTSADNDVIIAEVSQSHKADESKEYFISQATLECNLNSGNFIDISNKVDWDGKIYILSKDSN